MIYCNAAMRTAQMARGGTSAASKAKAAAAGAGIGAGTCAITGMCNESADDDESDEWISPVDDIGPDPLDNPDQCEKDPDPNKKDCQALKNSILKTCAGLSTRKQFNCWAAANIAYRQCMSYE